MGVLAIAYVLQLWLGLYGDPSEQQWTYMLLAMLMFQFVVEGSGRSLGFDAWLRRKVPAMREGKGLDRLISAYCGGSDFFRSC